MFNFSFLLSSIIFVVLDFMYLNITKNYFSNQVKSVQGTPIQMNFLGTIICYLFLIIGLNYFIIKPNRSVQDAFLLGLIIYGVFETTNLAIFKNWSYISVLLDTTWGGVLFALTTYLVKMVKKI